MKGRFGNLRSRYFLFPILGSIALITLWGRELTNVALIIPGSLLVASVFTAVHHAEVVALRVGDHFHRRYYLPHTGDCTLTRSKVHSE